MIDLSSSATAQRAALLARRCSARDLLEATLSRVARVNPGLNAIVHVDAARARADADASDARIADGTARPLEGLPISIKDAWDVAGMVSTAGAPAFKARVPELDASPVARLRAAGAVIFGKSNVPVFSGDFQTYNPLYGVTDNPWDAARSPGGSSGGAAAAVAAGLSAFELVSDLGGSARWPAHACGVFGLKTTWGLVSTWGHVPPPPDRRIPRNPELMVAGPMARTAADLALVLDVIAGPRDPAIKADPFAPARHASPKGLRVALWAQDPFAPVERACSDAVLRAADALARAGAIIDDKARPGVSFEEAYEVFAVINHAVVAYGLPAKMRDRMAASARQYARGDLSHRALQSRGARLTPDDYNDINARRLAVKRKWARFFTGCDVVLCPVAQVGAILHDPSPDIHARTLDVDGVKIPYLDFLKWASLATGADLPAVSAPVMLGPDGLPRGVQVIAAAGEDRSVVAVAGMIEALVAMPGLGAPFSAKRGRWHAEHDGWGAGCRAG